MADTVINLSEHRARRSQAQPETLTGLTPEYVTELLAKSVISFTDIKILELRCNYDDGFISPLATYLSGIAAGIYAEIEVSQDLTPEQRDMYDNLPGIEALNFAQSLEKLAERIEQTLAVGA